MEILYQIWTGDDFLFFDVDGDGMIILLEVYEQNLIDKFRRQPLTISQYLAVKRMIVAFFTDNEERDVLLGVIDSMIVIEREPTTEAV